MTGGRNLGEKWVAKDLDCQGNGGEAVALWRWVGLFGGTVVLDESFLVCGCGPELKHEMSSNLVIFRGFTEVESLSPHFNGTCTER